MSKPPTLLLLANFYGAYVDEKRFRSTVIVNNAGIEQLASMGVEEIKKYTDGTRNGNSGTYVLFVAGLTDVLIKSEEQGKNRLELTPNSMQLIDSKMQWASQVMTSVGATVIWTIMPPISLRMYHESEGWNLGSRALAGLSQQIDRDQQSLNTLMLAYRKSAMNLNKRSIDNLGPFFTDLVADIDRHKEEIILNTRFFRNDGITPSDELIKSWDRQLDVIIELIHRIEARKHTGSNLQSAAQSSGQLSNRDRTNGGKNRGSKRTRSESDRVFSKPERRSDGGRREPPGATNANSFDGLSPNTSGMNQGSYGEGGNPLAQLMTGPPNNQQFDMEKVFQMFTMFQNQKQSVQPQADMQAMMQMISTLQSSQHGSSSANPFQAMGGSMEGTNQLSNMTSMMQVVLLAKQKEDEQKRLEEERQQVESENRRQAELRKREAEERRRKEEQKRRVEEEKRRRQQEEDERKHRLAKERAAVAQRRLDEERAEARLKLEQEMARQKLIEDMARIKRQEEERQLYNIQQRAKAELILSQHNEQARLHGKLDVNDPFKARTSNNAVIPSILDIPFAGNSTPSALDRLNHKLTTRKEVPSTTPKPSRPVKPDPRWDQPILLFSHMNSLGKLKPIRGVRGSITTDKQSINNQRSQGIFVYEEEGRPFPVLGLMRTKLKKQGELTEIETRVADFNNQVMQLHRQKIDLMAEAKSKKVNIELELNDHLGKFMDKNVSRAEYEAQLLKQSPSNKPPEKSRKSTDTTPKDVPNATPQSASRLSKSSDRSRAPIRRHSTDRKASPRRSRSPRKSHSPRRSPARPSRSPDRIKRNRADRRREAKAWKDRNDKPKTVSTPGGTEKPRWDKSEDEEDSDVELIWESDTESVKEGDKKTKLEESAPDEESVTDKQNQALPEPTDVLTLHGEEFVTIDEAGKMEQSAEGPDDRFVTIDEM